MANMVAISRIWGKLQITRTKFQTEGKIAFQTWYSKLGFILVCLQVDGSLKFALGFKSS